MVSRLTCLGVASTSKRSELRSVCCRIYCAIDASMVCFVSTSRPLKYKRSSVFQIQTNAATGTPCHRYSVLRTFGYENVHFVQSTQVWWNKLTFKNDAEFFLKRLLGLQASILSDSLCVHRRVFLEHSHSLDIAKKEMIVAGQ